MLVWGGHLRRERRWAARAGSRDSFASVTHFLRPRERVASRDSQPSLAPLAVLQPARASNDRRAAPLYEVAHVTWARGFGLVVERPSLRCGCPDRRARARAHPIRSGGLGPAPRSSAPGTRLSREGSRVPGVAGPRTVSSNVASTPRSPPEYASPNRPPRVTRARHPAGASWALWVILGTHSVVVGCDEARAPRDSGDASWTTSPCTSIASLMRSPVTAQTSA